ncbi:MAG: hypothetical protein ACLSVD_10990 [Eggerthellaceae bacterium]
MDGVWQAWPPRCLFVAAAAIRVLGGWLGDRFDCYRLLARVRRPAAVSVLATAPGLPVYLAGIRSASHAASATAWCSLVPAYHEASRVANGIVAMMGGLRLLFPPLVLSASTLLFSTSVPGFAAFGALAPRLPGDFAGHERKTPGPEGTERAIRLLSVSRDPYA